jgi:serine/threonine protein kinase
MANDSLGTGSFGRVHLVRSRHNGRFYAVKVLNKEKVIKMKQVEHTNSEREMLVRVRHPFLVNLWGTFQDVNNLYMVMDFVAGGELFSLLRKSQVSQRSIALTKAIPQFGRQILRCRSGPRSRLPALARHHLPGSEAREPVIGSGRSRQSNRFRVCQACTGYHLDLVRDARLS